MPKSAASHRRCVAGPPSEIAISARGEGAGYDRCATPRYAPALPRSGRRRRAAANADPLLRYRSRFPILSSTTYLISNSLGAMPKDAEDDLAEYARTWTTRGVRAWAETWWGMAREVGDL